jgi:IclR family transcriptional regulator, KDG regulon repressor
MARTVPAVNRAFDILELFEHRDELTAAEIITTLKLPRTSVGELLNTLLERGYLVAVDPRAKRLRLGIRLFRLGSAYAERLDLAAEAQVAAKHVADACGETVQVAVLDGAAVVYIAKVDSVHSVRLVSAIGRSLPAHCTAVGKMLLSGLGDEEFDALYDGVTDLQTLTPKSIASVGDLRKALRKVRQSGVARENGESNFDVECVAAPVYGRSGEMVAAISIAVPTSRLAADVRSALAVEVQRGAEELSARLGYRAATQAMTP